MTRDDNAQEDLQRGIVDARERFGQQTLTKDYDTTVLTTSSTRRLARARSIAAIASTLQFV
jgi:hypothetical protein